MGTIPSVLSPDDSLRRPPRRVLVAGVSGAGKTTLAKRIAAILDAPYVEIDALYHGPDWAPRADFLEDVRSLVSKESWVTEWQYSDARPILVRRAEVMVWLDLPFTTVTLPRVVRRTFLRRLRREVLWNGNMEPPLSTFFTDPDHIVRWAFFTRNKYRFQVPALEATRPELIIVRLRSQREVDRWLTGSLARVAR